MTTTQNPPLLAYHGDPEIKRKYLNRVRAHQKADDIISGRYWENGKGCAVGCTLHSSEHAAYETELGIPRILAKLEDRLFEAIYSYEPATAKAWPARFLKAAKPGSDLSMVWPRFAHWLLVDEKEGVIRHAKTDRLKQVIQMVADLYAKWIGGNKPETSEWSKARSAAAYADAAYAAAAAAYAADAAADAAYAAYAAADAAYAAAAAAYAAARKTKYFRMADKLIELMETAK